MHLHLIAYLITHNIVIVSEVKEHRFASDLLAMSIKGAVCNIDS